jgi:hypothetical protein
MPKRIEFTPPKELLDAIGEGVQPGQRLDNMRTEFAVKDDGRWCIVRVDGVPFPGYDYQGNPTDERDDTMPEGSKFIDSYKNAMAEGSTDTGAPEGGGY